MKVTINAAWVQRKWDRVPRLEVDSNIDMVDLYKNSEDVVATNAGKFTLDLDIIPLDRAELVKTQVATLQREAGKHQAAITNIEARINELLCLEHKS